MPDTISMTVREVSISLPLSLLSISLKEKVGLCEEEMEKDGLSLNDLTILLTQLWCQDFKEYSGACPDRIRVQLSAVILLYCFMSAWSGEVHKSTTQKQKDKGEEEDTRAYIIAACYKARDTGRRKGRSFRSTHSMRSIKRSSRFFSTSLCSSSRWLLLTGHSCDYELAQEILNAVESIECGPEEKVIITFKFKLEVLDVPDIKLSTGRSQGADAFGKEFAELGHRNKHHSVAAPMKYAGHIHQDTFSRSYAHPLSEVDGLATYLGVSTQHEYIQDR
ncbi:conserved hypothetical protein [Aspergillus lentulus]|nr:conserved hypothetical protein [Aspergillus lentulus]